MQTARVEACLLPHLGPIAAMVVRRSSVAATDREAFARMVSESVADPVSRATVAQQVETILQKDE